MIVRILLAVILAALIVAYVRGQAQTAGMESETPNSTEHNLPNETFAYPEARGEFPLTHGLLGVKRPYLQHISRAQLGTAVVLIPCIPLLGMPVGQVVSNSADEEMLRVHTSWMVAGVTHQKAIRDWPHVSLVAKPVGPQVSAVSFSYYPITVSINRAGPEPTVVFLPHSAPESAVDTAIRRAPCWHGGLTCLATIPGRLIFHSETPSAWHAPGSFRYAGALS